MARKKTIKLKPAKGGRNVYTELVAPVEKAQAETVEGVRTTKRAVGRVLEAPDPERLMGTPRVNA